MKSNKTPTPRSTSTPRGSTRSVSDVAKTATSALKTKTQSKKKIAAPASSPRAMSPTSMARSMVRPGSPSRSVVGRARSQSDTGTSSADLIGVFKYTCEEVIYDELIALKTIIMKSSASRTFHDFSMLQGHISSRAASAVEEELVHLSEKLLALRGPSPNHRVTVFAQLLASLTNELELAVFNEDRRSVTNMKNDTLAAKMASDQLQAAWQEKLARKDQTIQALQADHASLDFKNKSLVRTVELLSKELEKCNASLTNVHQRSVEVRIQGIDFKAEVDKRADRILQSIQSRMGFVPGTIQKHVNQLTALLPPGDANYDKVRMDIYKRNGHSRSAPGTPTSTTRKAAQVLALQLQQSPRSSFTSSSPSTANQSQAPSLPATPPRQSGGTPKAVQSYVGAERGPPTPLPPAPATSPVISNRPFSQQLKVNTAPLEPAASTRTGAGATEFFRSTLSPSSREQQAQKRQTLITSLFPRSVTLQDTTGIAGISFPAGEHSNGREEEVGSPSSAVGSVFDGLSISGHAVALKPAASEADRRYVAKLAEEEDVMDEEGSEPEDDGSSPSASSSDDEDDQDDSQWQDGPQDDAIPQQTAALDAAEHEHITQHSSHVTSHYNTNHNNTANNNNNSVSTTHATHSANSNTRNNTYHITYQDSDYSETDYPDNETRTNPNASVRTASSTSSSSSQCSNSNSSTGESSAVSSTSAGADDELAAVRKTSSASSGVHHILPTSNSYLHVKQAELYSESDEGSDFHQNMQKFIQNFHEAQKNSSFKIDISDSEIEPAKRTNGANAGIAATGKRAAKKGNKIKAEASSNNIMGSKVKKTIKRA